MSSPDVCQTCLHVKPEKAKMPKQDLKARLRKLELEQQRLEQLLHANLVEQNKIEARLIKATT